MASIPSAPRFSHSARKFGSGEVWFETAQEKERGGAEGWRAPGVERLKKLGFFGQR